MFENNSTALFRENSKKRKTDKRGENKKKEFENCRISLYKLPLSVFYY